MAQIKAGSVAVEIIGDDANFKKAIEGVENAVKNIKFPGFTGIGAQFRDLTTTFVAAKSAIQDISGLLTGVFTDFASFGDQFSKAAQRTGANAAWLSEIGYAAEQSGASLESVGNGFKYLSKNFDLALRGGKQAAESFERLGLSVGQLAAMSAEERFLAVADALNQIKDESLQSAAAMQIFGRGGTELLPLIQEGAAGIAALMKEAADNGIGISEEDAALATRIGDTFDRLSATLRGLKNEFAASFGEPLNTALDGIRSFAAENRELILTVTKLAAAGTAGLAVWKSTAGISVVLQTSYAALTSILATQTAVTTAAGTAESLRWRSAIPGITTLKTLTAAEIAHSTAQTAATRTTRILTAAQGALNAVFAANPFLWVSAAVAGLAALSFALVTAAEKQAVLNETADKMRQNNDKSRELDALKMQRLQQLAGKQKLSNAEMLEAEKITGQLEDRYGKLGISLDKVGNSLSVAGNSMEKFNAAMAKSALIDLGTEIIESTQNIKSLEEAQKSLGHANSANGAFRELFAWASGGYVDTYDDKMNELDEQLRLQQEKLWAAQEKQRLIEGGMNPLDAVKEPKARLQEQVAEGNGTDTVPLVGIKEQENAEKRLADIQREIEKSRNSALHNEIEQLKERNQEQKKYLELLIAAEKEKPQANAGKIDEWTKAKAQADADLNRSLDDLLQKAKEGENRFGSEQLDFLKLFDRREQAAQAGDAAGYQKVQQELDALKKIYEQTQMKNLRQNLGTAVDEVKKYQNALDNAITTEEKIIAEQQLQAAKEHALKLYEQYDQISGQMSQKQFDELQAVNNAEGKKAETPGNSSAFVYGTREFYEYMAKAQNPQLKEAQKQTLKLASIDDTNKKTNRLLEEIGVV